MKIKTLESKRPFLALLLPISIYLILSFLYLLIIPAGESPDEPGHLRCIEQVSIENQIPISRSTVSEEIEWWARENIFSEYMCYHMPVYYILSGYIVRISAQLSNIPLHYEFPLTNMHFTDGISANESAMFEPIPHTSVWPSTQPLTLLSLRLVAILLGLFVIMGTWLIAWRVFAGKQWIALSAAVIVAGWPQFLFLSRAISNDTLATVLAVLTLVVLTNIGEPKRFKWAAGLAALAFLTKLSVAFVAVVVLLVWLLEWVWLADNKRQYWREFIYMLILWGATAVFVRLNSAVWGNWQQSAIAFEGVNDAAYTIAYWQQVYTWTLSSGWAWFGWLSLRPSEWHAQLWWFVIQISGLLGIYFSVRQVANKRDKVLLWVLAIWATAVFLSYIKVTANRWQPQFRFALSALPLLATFSAGSLFVLNKKWWRQLMPIFIAIVLFIYNVWLLFAIVQPAYS